MAVKAAEVTCHRIPRKSRKNLKKPKNPKNRKKKQKLWRVQPAAVQAEHRAQPAVNQRMAWEWVVHQPAGLQVAVLPAEWELADLLPAGRRAEWELAGLQRAAEASNPLFPTMQQPLCQCGKGAFYCGPPISDARPGRFLFSTLRAVYGHICRKRSGRAGCRSVS